MINRADVVLVRFPFASGTAAKIRPALVIQNDRNNARLNNVIVVAITTTTQRSSEPSQLLIEVTSPAGRQSGLLKDSLVSCENIATIEMSLVLRTIGSLPENTMKHVGECLKESLGLN